MKDEDDKVVEEKVPIFNEEDTEGLFEMVDKVLKLALDYEWFLHDNSIKKKAFTMIRHALSGKPEKHWGEVMQEVENFTEKT